MRVNDESASEINQVLDMRARTLTKILKNLYHALLKSFRAKNHLTKIKWNLPDKLSNLVISAEKATIAFDNIHYGQTTNKPVCNSTVSRRNRQTRVK